MVYSNNLLYGMVLSIIVLLSLFLYSYPKLFAFFFGSRLGNIVLILAVVFLGFYNYRLALGLGSLFVLLFQAFRLSSLSPSLSPSLSYSNNVEGFSWSSDLVDQFVKYQKTFNPQYTFDVAIVQKQASPDDVQYLFANNKWPWSPEIQQMYKDYVTTDSSVSMDPAAALTVAQSVYNETAIKEIMSWNTKEGSFLLTGVNIGHSEGVPENVNNTVRCGMDDKTGANVMEKIVNLGYASIHGNMVQNKEVLNNEDLPSVVPGFKFLGSPCNPCGALNTDADYSCPFSLDIGDGAEVSPIWSVLWGQTDDNEEKKEFPILNELKNELNNLPNLYNPVVTKDSNPVGTKEGSDLNSNM